MTVDYLGIIFGCLVAIGGIIGYVKEGSTASIISGLIFGVLIGVGAYLSSRAPPIYYLSLAVSLTLAGIMFWRFYASSWKFMPAGLVFSIRESQFVALSLLTDQESWARHLRSNLFYPREIPIRMAFSKLEHPH